MPATKVFLDLGHRGDVYRVAGEYPVTHRESVTCDRQTDHDLWCVATTVLAVTSFPGGSIGLFARRRAAVNLAVLVAFVFLVGLEGQRGGVVEDHLHVKIEQVSDPKEDGLLDGFLVRLQEVHGAVELVQFQLLRPFDVCIFLEPLLMAVEFGGRSAGAVGNQGEQGALDIESETPLTGLLLHNGVNAELLPDGFGYVDVAIGPSADQAPVDAGAHDLFR